MTGVVRVPVLFVNAYLVEANDGFVLVDSGLRGIGATLIRVAVQARFGSDVRPRGIVLTHGHFDHAGSARALAKEWDVPIYAHRLELPYLRRESEYPPEDPTVGGTLANLSRLFPRTGSYAGPRLRPLATDGEIPGLPGWRALPTPGHTQGHVSLFRESDGVLLAGDALATMDQESPLELLVQHRQLRQPPAPLTTDWQAAQRSIEHLATLRPQAIAAGHGLPMVGPDVAEALSTFARNFAPPAHGRYVNQPARADEAGLIYVPPPVPDPIGLALRAAGVGAVAAALLMALGRRSDPDDPRAFDATGRRSRSS